MRPEFVFSFVLFFCTLCIEDASTYKSPYYVGIRNGQRASPDEFQYQVALQMKKAFYCSGFIISDRYVLTAAYCIPKNRIYHGDMTVLVGTKDLNQGGDIYQVAKAIAHQRYNFTTMDYDIGLIKLARPLTNDDQALEVAPLANGGPLFSKGMTFEIAGWGWPSMSTQITSRYLLKSNVLWMDQNTCRKERQNSIVVLTFRHFCSIMDNGPCMYDYGGPVVYKGTIIGIISGATWMCELYPPVYTKVSAYRDWIDENIQQLDKLV